MFSCRPVAARGRCAGAGASRSAGWLRLPHGHLHGIEGIATQIARTMPSASMPEAPVRGALPDDPDDPLNEVTFTWAEGRVARGRLVAGNPKSGAPIAGHVVQGVQVGAGSSHDRPEDARAEGCGTSAMCRSATAPYGGYTGSPTGRS